MGYKGIYYMDMLYYQYAIQEVRGNALVFQKQVKQPGHALIGQSIRITCPCNIYPLIPHYYIAKLGYAGIHVPIFLNFAPKHELWVRLAEAVLTCTHNLCFEQRY